jgi:hypothetical protein
MISHTARQITATTGTTMRDRPEPSMPDGSLARAEERAAADAAVAEVADPPRLCHRPSIGDVSAENGVLRDPSRHRVAQV